ncbi:hypothetical protein HDU97_010097 [Phlyctochytrium planicorne]|nr:hypothetical protein HDU97_010097 [Phlyctochytrium planicorne]
MVNALQLLAATAFLLATSASAQLSSSSTASAATSTTDVADAPASTTSTADAAPPAITPSGSLARLERSKILLGAWVDTSPEGNDLPSKFNDRLGYKAGVFQYAQDIPLGVDPANPTIKKSLNYSHVDDGTDALILLTVYPNSGLDKVTQDDIDLLSAEITEIKTKTNKDVIIRYGPEMNGEWFIYGKQPDAYIESFKKVATTLHAKNPSAAMLWSPNFDKDGSSYASYYPGDEYVDWVGLSVYYKGPKGRYPWITNINPPEEYFNQLTNAGGPEGGPVAFYDVFAAGKDKPFALSEGAAAYHINYTSIGGKDFQPNPSDTGVTQVSLQMGWWNPFLFSETYLDSHPKFKLACLFEYAKPENESTVTINRDFRSTYDPAVRAAFTASLAKVANRFAWANATVASTTSAAPSSTAAPNTASVNPVTTTKPSGAVGVWSVWKGVMSVGVALVSVLVAAI